LAHQTEIPARKKQTDGQTHRHNLETVT
jgi:hypothetical protein